MTASGPVGRAEGLLLQYGKVRALDAVSIDLPAGCIVGLIGPDGVGKSSFLALIAGARKIQTGRLDVLGGDMRRAGMGRSERPSLKAEFSDLPFDRGVVGMARSQDPNSANSQFFIMFEEGHFLNGQYTVIGRVTSGMDVVDAIKLGQGPNGAVIGEPDVMKTVTVTE